MECDVDRVARLVVRDEAREEAGNSVRAAAARDSVLLAFWLVFDNNLTVLNARIFPENPVVLWIGLALTALGIGICIWARLSLGANWSGIVTLKQDHELVRKGLYRWIRHPIYTGILVGFIGTAMIKDHARGVGGIAVLLRVLFQGTAGRKLLAAGIWG